MLAPMTNLAVAPEPTDAELMRRVVNRDRTAYALLVERHLARLLALAERVTQRRAEAEDVVQEVFIKLWLKAADWQEGKSALGTWLYRITLNQALDGVRKVRPSSLPDDYDAPDPRAETLTHLVLAEKAEALRAAIKKLPERQRAAVALSYQEEITDAAAAEVMGVTVKAYESLLVRARKTLREAMMAGGWHEA